MADSFDLQRFLDAQADAYDDVLAELHSGRKTSHWMWFIFPQLRGLGHSPTAEHFAIQSLEEARAYLVHSILGPRLRECTALVNQIPGRSVEQIFGFPDNLKFRSSLTLFLQASSWERRSPGRPAPSTADRDLFFAALGKYFHGEPDPLTLSLLKR
jgi:uncharacterized protein (DUF1810 family)